MAKKAKTPVVELKESEVEAPEDAEEMLFGEEDLENSGLRELLDKGKDQGFLTYQEINSMLPEDISDPDQVEENTPSITQTQTQTGVLPVFGRNKCNKCQTSIPNNTPENKEKIQYVNNLSGYYEIQEWFKYLYKRIGKYYKYSHNKKLRVFS